MKIVADSMTEMEEIILNLRKKLDIAVNVLEEIDKFKDREFKGNQTILTVILNNWLMAHKALEKIKEVK